MRVASASVVPLPGTELLWRFSVSGLSTMLMLTSSRGSEPQVDPAVRSPFLIFSIAARCLFRKRHQPRVRQMAQEKAGPARPMLDRENERMIHSHLDRLLWPHHG